MQYRISILFLLVHLLVVALASPIWACGSNTAHASTKTKETSCCQQNSDAQNSDCSNESDPCSKCTSNHAYPNSGNCGHEGCHCDGCGTVSGGYSGGLLTEIPIIYTSSTVSGALKKQAFYFAEHIPEAVYLPIWQPPKIGV
jgi:hypothetical protein